MIKVLLVPSSDYLGHPFPQRHNQIFEELNTNPNFEVHVARFNFFTKNLLKTKVKIHSIKTNFHSNSLPLYYLLNATNHAAQIRQIIRREGIDVLVLSNLAAPLAYTLMDEISGVGVPIIVDLPDFFPTSAGGYLFNTQSIQGQFLSGSFDFMLRRIMKHADVVTVVSDSLKEYAIQCGARKVAKVPNGISNEFLEVHNGDSVRHKFGFSKDDFVVGYVGSVEFWLNMVFLIKGLGGLLRDGYPAKLLIVGKSLHTNYTKRVEKLIEKEGIGEAVTWCNFVPHSEVPEYISAMDVGTIPFDVLNPTASYSSPNKIWEYLSQNRPVVSTPIPEAINNIEYLSIANTPEDFKQVFARVYRKDTSLIQKTSKGYDESKFRTWRKATDLFAEEVFKVLGSTQKKQ